MILQYVLPLRTFAVGTLLINWLFTLFGKACAYSKPLNISHFITMFISFLPHFIYRILSEVVYFFSSPSLIRSQKESRAQHPVKKSLIYRCGTVFYGWIHPVSRYFNNNEKEYRLRLINNEPSKCIFLPLTLHTGRSILIRWASQIESFRAFPFMEPYTQYSPSN